MINYIKTQGQLIAHKAWVFWFMTKVSAHLMWRALKHDMSKFTNAESLYFSKNANALKNTPYATPEYAALLKSVQPAIDHHYDYNSHHPQHYPNGYEGMSALDKIEMACDIAAAVKRTKDGNVRVSIEKNQERFNYSNGEKKWMHSLTDTLENKKHYAFKKEGSIFDDINWETRNLNRILEEAGIDFRVGLVTLTVDEFNSRAEEAKAMIAKIKEEMKQLSEGDDSGELSKSS